MTSPAVLIITLLTGEISGYVTYPSMETCNRATAAVSDGLGYDHRMNCEPTADWSIRPRRNPRYQDE